MQGQEFKNRRVGGRRHTGNNPIQQLMGLPNFLLTAYCLLPTPS